MGKHISRKADGAKGINQYGDDDQTTPDAKQACRQSGDNAQRGVDQVFKQRDRLTCEAVAHEALVALCHQSVFIFGSQAFQVFNQRGFE